jgi:hypothetical protein
VGLLGKTEGPSNGKAGRVMWKVGTSNIVASYLYQLSIEGLVPVSKYWSHGDMSPANWCNLFANKWLPLAYCFNDYHVRETGARHTDRSADGLWIVSGDLFLRSNRIHPTLLGKHKRLPCTRNIHKKRMCGIHGLAQETYVSCVSDFPLYGVH